MKVAINTRLLLSRPEGIGNYILETITRMAESNPHDEFHLIFDRPMQQNWLMYDNMYGHVLGPPTRHPLLWKYWFDFRLPTLLRQLGTDCFFSPEGMLSLRTDTPTMMTVHDLAYLEYPKGSIPSHRRFLLKHMPLYMDKANRIVCVSKTTENNLLTHFPEAVDKSTTIENGVHEKFKPISETEKSEFREKYTKGRPYILYLGSLHPRKNIVHLIAAFEQFKNNGHEEFVLVLAGRFAWKSREIKRKMNQSSIRSDIIHLSDFEENIVSLYGASNFFCYPSFFEGFGLPVLEAMACGVPVLTSRYTSMQEVCGDAAKYFDPNNVKSIADAMKDVAGNFHLRRKMTDLGINRSRKFSWRKAAEKLYNELELLAKK